MQIAAEPSRRRTVAQPFTSPGIIILSGAEGCKLRPTIFNECNRLISSFEGFPWGRMLVSSTRYQRIAVVLNQPQMGARGKAERMISMESEIKIGQQFEFAIHADKGFRQKAVVTRVLSNREEGLGPEADYYIADWIEARTLSEQPKALVFVLANDGNVYLNGEWVDIIVDLAA
jgi:hypothetical protein